MRTRLKLATIRRRLLLRDPAMPVCQYCHATTGSSYRLCSLLAVRLANDRRVCLHVHLCGLQLYCREINQLTPNNRCRRMPPMIATRMQTCADVYIYNTEIIMHQCVKVCFIRTHHTMVSICNCPPLPSLSSLQP